METPGEVNYKSGFVAIMGRPNVGKSTLINSLLGQKIAAVSPRPQTTRKQQLGILTLEDAQIVFMDTPGVHNPRHRLGEHMNQEALDSLESTDQILFMVDVSQVPHEEDRMLAELLEKVTPSIARLLVLNKVDLLTQEDLIPRQQDYQALLPGVKTFLVSATTGEGLAKLIEEVVANLPAGPPFYPEDQITDLYEREIAADLIREAALYYLHDEVPHSLAVRIDEFKERDTHGAYIAATLFVERESQKPIVIGKGGSMLKQIGTLAREEIEAMSGRKVYLELRVKVRRNWRNDENALRLFGFKPLRG